MKNYSSDQYTLEQCKEDFIDTLKGVKREGIDNLLKYLEKTDFYTAPASIDGHECREGGLLRHSLNVYNRILITFTNEYRLRKEEFEKAGLDKISQSMIVVGLLHEICNASRFKPVTTSESDPKTGEVKETITGYKVCEKALCYGHGEESVYKLSGFIKLDRDEAFAIRFHEGDFSNPNTAKAYEKYELALWLHNAILQAIFIDEK